MAGTGPLRKLDDQRARRNKDHIATTVMHRTPEPQPDLPGSIDWHPQTLLWWHMWGQTELADDFTNAEWSYLIDTALIHNEFWTNGNMSVASELRLRAAKFGVTPEDRHRLRIVVVTATDLEDKAEATRNAPNSRGRYSPPEAV